MLKNKRLLYGVLFIMLTGLGFDKKDATGTVVTPPVKKTNTFSGTCWFPFSYAKPALKAPARRITASDALYPGETLYQGDYLQSPDGRCILYMQHDGNLVLYCNDVPIWSTGTCCNSSINRCEMQEDGNLVVYDTSNVAHWNAGTHGHPRAFLLLTWCCDLLIIQNGSDIWSSNTNCC